MEYYEEHLKKIAPNIVFSKSRERDPSFLPVGWGRLRSGPRRGWKPTTWT